jgi:hypothetical protein
MIAMMDEELDVRLGELLREPYPDADQRFIDATIAAVRLDNEIRRARKSAFRRTIIECASAVAVAGTFFLLSQAQPASPDGIVPLQAPAMAGLIMLGLWSVMTLNVTGTRPHRV